MNDLTAPDFQAKLSPWTDWAKSLAIATPEQYATASEQLKGIKALVKEIEASYGPLKQKASEAHKAIVAEEKRQLAPLVDAEATCKTVMLKYTAAEQAKAEAERRRLQAIADEKARVERAALDAAAAKQRAIEAEARAKAEAARQAAMQASEAERKRLLAQAEAAERKAEKAAAVVEAKQEAAAQVAAPVIAVQAPVIRVAGQKTSTTWVHEITDLPKFMAWAAENKRWDLLLPNEKMIAQYARSMRENSKMDGVKFTAKETLSSTSR